MKWLTLFTAILLAACAAYFSIVGLMTIFAGAAMSVMVMAGVLEFAKLVSAAWLHYEWDRINNLVRIYFTTAVLVLMFITSMGIFGYLSKAHIDQTIQVGGNNDLRIEMLERKIQRQQDIIDDSEKVVAQLDEAVETLQEYDRIRGPSGSIAVRASQQEERQTLNQTIEDAYSSIETLQTELLPLKKQQISLEAEIGPLKYITELIYGKENSRDNFDSAVRGIIILLVIVFDPLAVMLLIVSTGAFKRDRKKIKPLIDEDQIMRMDIDESGTDDGNDGGAESAPESGSREADRKEDSESNTVTQSAEGDGQAIRPEWSVSIDGSTGKELGQDDVDWDHAPSKDEYKKQNKGLTTVLSRRPV